MTTTIYKSSSGEKLIADMPLSYAKNAVNKLIRTEPGRIAEIDALQAHVDKLSAEAEAKALAGNDDANPRAVIGGNNPPEETPAPKLEGRAAIEAHADDLLTEAANWADGVAIENEGQAAKVGTLHRSLQEVAGLVNKQADDEKRPLNDAVNEIAKWQNGYTAKAGMKTIPAGSLTKAIAATGRLSAAWLQKLDDERKQREKAAADAAFAAAQEAMALRTEAKETTDLAVMDRAEDALAGAKALLREAEVVSKEKVRVEAGEGQRAMTLRTIYHAELIDAPNSYALAYGHYKQNPEFMAEFHGLIQRWATRDARVEATRVRGIPGFKIREEKVV
ncbi:hypothetical protein [Novosphingobium sp. KA1]|uniref:hypothetical protein n=1 Tax=Novosphingobium sp. (strain KA1) TaxID=164608 RepID=UPI001A8FFB49|nr:hypothetical protein [Novosphingobium sp. KA1]QSR18448.1 hypothetical protein CA833_14840 [Novosphingobium sp. KA1]